MPADSAPCTGIRFANGQQWRLIPTDPLAEETVRDIAEVMQLSPATGGPDLYVATGWSTPGKPKETAGPEICLLPPGNHGEVRINRMSELAKAIALRTLPAGGLLLHGALAEKDGRGVILAAPGGTGKTTASNRLPLPWRSLSDDATLVVPDGNGGYRAHPWPTWSRFRDHGPGGRWNVEESVPLAALFFLSRAEDDRAEPAGTGDAVAYITESVHQTTGIPSQPGRTPEEAARHCEEEIAAATALARAIPAYRLEICLTGTFWDAIENALARQAPRRAKVTVPPEPVPGGTGRAVLRDPGTGLFGPGHIPVVYTGPSMNPTLVSPDLLDVVPYGEAAPVAGDVVCFLREATGQVVVHRIVRIAGARIVTQGDNNPEPDPDLLQAGDILGKVIGARRGETRRAVTGGITGRAVFRCRRIATRVRNAAGILLRSAGPAWGITRSLARFLPACLKPRVVFFATWNYGTLRLYFGRSFAGDYDPARGSWKIRLPYRMLVSADELPGIDELKRCAPARGPAAGDRAAPLPAERG
ncbi:MAG: SynChlorMet cassette protein ScmC [Methanoregula sp.]|nr:SynChlorMet cassette protein ScmC [Methanoregula sp.]